jgi:hypothetical protein
MAIVAAKMNVKQFPSIVELKKFLKDAANNINIIHAAYSTNNGGHVLVYEAV